MAIQEGDQVSVEYTGRLESGEMFDSSEGRGPLSFTVGSGEVIPGFDRAVLGKQEGDETKIEVPPEEGYGPHREELVQELPRDRVQGEGLEIGQVLGLQDDKGGQYQAKIVGMTDDLIKLDFNHFLAGKTLHFDIKVVGVA